MNIKKKPRSIRIEISLLVIGVVFLSIFSLSTFTILSISRSHEDLQIRKVGGLAQIVAKMPQVVQALGQGDPEKIIPDLAGEIGQKTDTWVVVMDMKSIRFSHPNPSLIGLKFTGGDEGPALAGKSYTSRAVGISGPSLRGFAPVYNPSNRQIGAVEVGVLLDSLYEVLDQTKNPIYLATFLSAALGILGAFFVANRIKNTIIGYEPYEISTKFQELDAILSSITSGIVAVDRDGGITTINKVARTMIGISESDCIIGTPIFEVLPNTRLPQVMENGQPEYDQEQVFPEGNKVITTRIPIFVKGEIVGAVAIFRPKTEITKLAEELTGVKKYVKALRAQSHEFVNKLQTISGLIELGDYDSSVAYINKMANAQKNLISLIVQNIKDPFVGGLLIGKISEAAEKGVSISLDPESRLTKLPGSLEENSITTIIGNLIDNAIDAVQANAPGNRTVTVFLTQTKDSLSLYIKDNGTGIHPDDLLRILDPGFSTKGENRGFGLHNVKLCLESLKGRLEILSEPGKGTEIKVGIPFC